MTLPAHSPIGASSASRWMACPGSVRLSIGLPNESSEYAREGTAAHEVAAECLRHGQDAWEHAGRTIKIEGHEYPVDDEMIECVQVYLDAIRKRVRTYEVHLIDQGLPTDGENAPVFFIEKQFQMSSIDENLFGTADCAVIFPVWRSLWVFDLKYGVGVGVEVKDNPQLKYYAAGVIHDLEGYDLDGVTCAIVQPRHDHPDGHVRSWSTTVDSLGEWVWGELSSAVKATRRNDAPLNPGDHCRFCPARQNAVCTALADNFDEMAAEAEAEDTEANRLDTLELAARMEKIPALRAYISALEDEAYKRIMSGEDIPGQKLVETKSNRVWKEGAEDAVVAKYGEQAYDKKLRSPSQLERLPDGRAFASEWAYKPTGRLTIAPESDKRAAVPLRTATEAFQGV